MKKITLLVVAFFLFCLISCKKADVIKFELSLFAKKPSIGTTTFTEISYHNGTQLQTISNSSAEFETTFEVPSGYNINYLVKGTTLVSSGTSATPLPFIGYQLVQIKNETERTTLCDGTITSTNGSNGKYTFTATFNKVFDGTGCK